MANKTHSYILNSDALGQQVKVTYETPDFSPTFTTPELVQNLDITDVDGNALAVSADVLRDVSSFVRNNIALQAMEARATSGGVLGAYNNVLAAGDSNKITASDIIDNNAQNAFKEAGFTILATGAAQIIKYSKAGYLAAVTGAMNLVASQTQTQLERTALTTYQSLTEKIRQDISSTQLIALTRANGGFDGHGAFEQSLEVAAGQGFEVELLDINLRLLSQAETLLRLANSANAGSNMLEIATIANLGLSLVSKKIADAGTIGKLLDLSTGLEASFQGAENQIVINELANFAATLQDYAYAQDELERMDRWEAHLASKLQDTSGLPEPEVTAEVTSSDPELSGTLPPLPGRKPDTGEDPDTGGDPSEEPSDEEPTDDDQSGPKPADMVILSNGDEKIVFIFGEDETGNGSPDSFLEHRFGDQAQSTTSHRIVNGEIVSEVLEIVVRGTDRAATLAPQITDLVGLLTPDLRSLGAQAALAAFTDTALENVMEAGFLATIDAGLPDDLSIGNLLELSAGDKIRYDEPVSPTGESLGAEFFGHSAARLSTVAAAWLAEEFNSVAGIDGTSLPGRLTQTLVQHSALTGVHWAGNFLADGLGVAQPFDLPSYQQFWQSAGATVTSAGINYLLTEAFGDIGGNPETEKGAIALSVTQSLFAIGASATSLFSTVGALIGLTSWAVPIVGPVLTFALGELLTPLINKIFGHDDTIALATVRGDLETNTFRVVSVTEDDGGSLQYARAQGNNVSNLVNAVLAAGDADLTRTHAGKIGHTDEKDIGGPNYNGEQWHYANGTRAVEHIASRALILSGLSMNDADYQRAYETVGRNAKFATNLLETFNTLNLYNAIAQSIDALRAAQLTEPNNLQLSEAIAAYDSALANGLVQVIEMDARATGEDDRILGGGLSDVLLGAVDHAEHIYGNAGDDTIDGGGGQDVIFGGSGNDFITADTGDIVLAGEGNDAILLLGDHATIDGGTGHDVLFLSANRSDTEILDGDGTLTRIKLADGTSFAVSRIEALGFTDGMFNLLDRKDLPEATDLADLSIGSREFIVEFDLATVENSGRVGILSLASNQRATFGVTLTDGDTLTAHFFEGNYAVAGWNDLDLADGLAHRIRIVAQNEDTFATLRLYVDDVFVGLEQLTMPRSNASSLPASYTVGQLTSALIGANYQDRSIREVFPLRDGEVTNVAIYTPGMVGPDAPIVFGEDDAGPTGKIYEQLADGTRNAVFDGLEVELDMGLLRVDGDTYTLSPTQLDLLQAGQVVEETVTLTAATGQTAELIFRVEGADDPSFLDGRKSFSIYYDEGSFTDTYTLSDLDNPDVAVTGIASGPQYGTATFADGVVTYTLREGLSPDLRLDKFVLAGNDGTQHTVNISIGERVEIAQPYAFSETEAAAIIRYTMPDYMLDLFDSSAPIEFVTDYSVFRFEGGNRATYQLTVDLAEDAVIQERFSFGQYIHFDIEVTGEATTPPIVVPDPDPDPNPDPDLPPDPEPEVDPDPTIYDITIAGSQSMRGTNGAVAPTLVSSLANERSLMTDYGQLTIDGDGTWAWLQDRDAARGLDAGERFEMSYQLGEIDIKFDIWGLEDTPRTGGVTYTTIRVDETSIFEGAINVSDPDLSDNPTFAGAIAEGVYGRAVVSQSGDIFRYTVDRSGTGPEENVFQELLTFVTDDGHATKTVRLNLSAREGQLSDYFGTFHGTLEDDVLSGFEGADTLKGHAGNDDISSGAGDDALYGGDGDDLLSGGDGNDRVVGDAGHDTLHGGGGDDLIKAKSGGSEIDGGTGNDRIIGSEETDTVLGAMGSDTIAALSGHDTVDAGADRDVVYAGNGNDLVFGDAGDDKLFGNRGADTLHGGIGDDSVFGGGSADVILGGMGSDFLVGENHGDTLNGGAGNDVLIGGYADTSLDGWQDTFVFISSDAGGGGYDRLRGFEDGIDLLDLSGFGFTNFATDVMPFASEAHNGVRLNFGGGDVVFIEDFVFTNFDQGDVIL